MARERFTAWKEQEKQSYPAANVAHLVLEPLARSPKLVTILLSRGVSALRGFQITARVPTNCSTKVIKLSTD